MRTAESGAKPRYAVPAVEKTFAVIELFASNNRGYTLSEVSRLLKLPISTASSLLYTMQACGYLYRDAKGQFYLSMQIVIQASKVSSQLRPREIAETELIKLTATTGLTSVLAIPDGNQLVWIEKIEGTGHIQLAAQVGKRMNLHHTSTGKAILAHLPDEQVEAIIKSVGLPAQTPNTITSVTALRKELSLVRAQGYAIDNQETAIGIVGVAAPVFDHKAQLVGSVGVGGAVFEMDQNLKPVIAVVKKCAKAVSEKLGYEESAVNKKYLPA
jgi:DNA-binding IclR family transcriptional regulator